MFIVLLFKEKVPADKIDQQHTRSPADKTAVEGRARIFIDNERAALGNVVNRLKQDGEKVSDNKRYDCTDQNQILQFGGQIAPVCQNAEKHDRRDDPHDYENFIQADAASVGKSD